MVTRHGRRLRNLALFWHNVRTFFHTHKTLFDTVFLGVYTLEQITLFILILILKQYAHVFAGVFAILIIATISFEKICMESRYRVLGDELWKQFNERDIIVQRYNELVNKYNELAREYETLLDHAETRKTK